MRDALTGLYDQQRFKEAMRSREVAQAGVIICFVDELAMVNQSFGFDVGDALLQVAAVILELSCDAKDFKARIDGDKFAVLLTCDSEMLAERCRKLREHVEIYNNDQPVVPINVSVGWAVNNQKCGDMLSIFAMADYFARTEKEIKQSRVRHSIFHSIKQALADRDYLKQGHGERVENLLVDFALAMGFPASTYEQLRLLAQFHDIGKVGLPDTILFKTEFLTESEWRIMCSHAEIGYRIANWVPELKPIAQWILLHHEWWNGQGYPMKLTGESLPLVCRMFAIVDSFDAMTSSRPYRKEKSIKEALQELQKCAGSQFDPQLVDWFIQMISDKYSEVNKPVRNL